jgi:hypothetical protein
MNIDKVYLILKGKDALFENNNCREGKLYG